MDYLTASQFDKADWSSGAMILFKIRRRQKIDVKSFQEGGLFSKSFKP
jgi:hypothetical protein